MPAKVINLDKFKVRQEVELDGKRYTVRGLTVSEYLDETYQAELDAAQTQRDVVSVMLKRLTQLSDIPEDILCKQDISVLQVLVSVAQGVDVEDGKSADPQKAE